LVFTILSESGNVNIYQWNDGVSAQQKLPTSYEFC